MNEHREISAPKTTYTPASSAVCQRQRAGKNGMICEDKRPNGNMQNSAQPIQMVKVTMPDGKEVDTDYMSLEQLDEAMTAIQKAMFRESAFSPLQKFYETNYHKLSAARLQQSHGKHLLIGEGDFGFANAQSKQQNIVNMWHPPVHATEFRQESQLEQDYPASFKSNVKKVKEQGGSVQYGVDATDLESSLEPQHFPIITSMFPNTGSRNRKTQGPL